MPPDPSPVPKSVGGTPDLPSNQWMLGVPWTTGKTTRGLSLLDLGLRIILNGESTSPSKVACLVRLGRVPDGVKCVDGLDQRLIAGTWRTFQSSEEAVAPRLSTRTSSEQPLFSSEVATGGDYRGCVPPIVRNHYRRGTSNGGAPISERHHLGLKTANASRAMALALKLNQFKGELIKRYKPFSTRLTRR